MRKVDDYERIVYYLGLFGSIGEAAEARQRAEAEFYGDFLEWYSKEYPEKWAKMKEYKIKKNKSSEKREK